MENLRKIKNQFTNKELTTEQSLKKIFEVYLITNTELNKKGLTIKYFDYGIWQLKQEGEFLMEGEKSDCQEMAFENTK